MTLRVPFQDEYGICIQSTSISTAKTFLATDEGILTGKHKVLTIDDHPNLNTGLNIIKTRKATGLAVMRTGTGYEYVQGDYRPTVTLRMHLNAFNLALFGYLLFQSGVSQGGASVYAKTMIPYTSADCQIWASVLRKMSAGTADSHVIHGAICRTLTITGTEGEPCVLTAELMGASFSDTFDFDAQASVLDEPEKVALTMADLTCIMEAADEVYLPDFEISFTNSAFSKNYNNSTIQKHILGDLLVTGNFGLPRDSGDANQDDNAAIDDYIAGNDLLFKIYNDAMPATGDADISIQLNVRHENVETIDLGGELGSRITFEHAYDGTNDISIVAGNSEDWSGIGL